MKQVKPQDDLSGPATREHCAVRDHLNLALELCKLKTMYRRISPPGLRLLSMDWETLTFFKFFSEQSDLWMHNLQEITCYSFI